MLTKADDYPIHQTPDPIAVSENQNLYDRYFFNGFARDGYCFFGATLGVYPHLGIMDGAFAVAFDGMQENLRVSRHLVGGDRIDTQVSPLSIRIEEPLKRLQILVEENDYGLSADLRFTGRTAPLEEPRQRSIRSGRVTLDITRMTQNGAWEGWIQLRGRRMQITPEQVPGVRDRSWGFRGVGTPRKLHDMYWLWAPLQAADREFLFYAIEKPDGSHMIIGAQMAMLDGSAPEHMADAWADVIYRPGTCEVAEATIHMVRKRGKGSITIRLAPSRQGRLFLSGLGYGHQTWGHGFDQGILASTFDSFETGAITVHRSRTINPAHIQYQARTEAEVTMPDGSTMPAFGMLEQIIIGDHAPSGLRAD